MQSKVIIQKYHQYNLPPTFAYSTDNLFGQGEMTSVLAVLGNRSSPKSQALNAVLEQPTRHRLSWGQLAELSRVHPLPIWLSAAALVAQAISSSWAHVTSNQWVHTKVCFRWAGTIVSWPSRIAAALFTVASPMTLLNWISSRVDYSLWNILCPDMQCMFMTWI